MIKTTYSPEALQDLRLKKGVSRFTMAKEINLTEKAIYRYEKGEFNPTPTNLEKLSKYFGVCFEISAD